VEAKIAQRDRELKSRMSSAGNKMGSGRGEQKEPERSLQHIEEIGQAETKCSAG